MIGRRSPAWPRLLVVVAVAQPLPSGMATQPERTAAARRLELAADRRDGVVPVAIAADRAQWRSVTDEDAAKAAIDVSTSDVIRWGTCPPWPTGPMVLLGDGDVLAGRIVAADERTVVVASASLGQLTLPAGWVRGYRAGQADGPGPVAAPAASATSRDRQTVLLLANGDRMAVRRIAWRDGTLAVELAAGRPTSDATAAIVTIPATVVRAVDFAAPALPPNSGPRPRILASLMDGSRFTIGTLGPAPPLAGAPRLRLALRLPEATVATECDADELLAIAVDGGRVELLARREPIAYEQTSELGPPWPLARGRALTGGWPALRGTTAFSALGVHATARVRYLLDEPATRFRSLVAVDDSAGSGGSVVVRVLAGGAGQSGREVFSSGVLRGGEPPVSIDVGFPAATELQLVVEPADGDDVLDRTLWLDPLVLRGGE